jgi:hypothetical protein
MGIFKNDESLLVRIRAARLCVRFIVISATGNVQILMLTRLAVGGTVVILRRGIIHASDPTNLAEATATNGACFTLRGLLTVLTNASLLDRLITSGLAFLLTAFTSGSGVLSKYSLDYT